MRTTINFTEEASEILRAFAAAGGLTLSQAASTLIVMAVQPRHSIRYKDGIPVLSNPEGATITLEDLKRISQEMDDEEAQKAFRLTGPSTKQKSPSFRRS